jgi:hypothetical protein
LLHGTFEPGLKKLDVRLDAVPFEPEVPSLHGGGKRLAQLEDASHPLLDLNAKSPNLGNDLQGL